jgi:hypothetical protein
MLSLVAFSLAIAPLQRHNPQASYLSRTAQAAVRRFFSLCHASSRWEDFMKLVLNLLSVGFASAALLALPVKTSAQALPDYNYLGLGGGDDGLVVNGKFTLSDNVSVRPSVATDFDFDDGEDVSYLLPITYDFNAINASDSVYPFVGAGIGGDLGGDDNTVEFALTGGVDYRMGDRWVANGSVNYLPFADSDEVGFTLGVGYTFAR